MVSLRALALPLAALAFEAQAQNYKNVIRNTKHDFSVSSTATIRASAEPQICLFCHISHAASPSVPLWNHKLSAVTSYGLYSSSTMTAVMPQPVATDSSKLCLSCHDGTVALGDTVNSGMIPFIQGGTYMLPSTSSSNIHKGTGFADDHPFAFVPVTGTEIVNPPVGDKVKRDALGKIQCITCHDSHREDADPTTRKFLVKLNQGSAICLTCHTKTGWNASQHKQPSDATNNARYTATQGAHTGYTGVSNNGCESCHRPHTPQVGARLVKYVEENTCYKCHDGSVATTARNIQNEFATKAYKHPVLTTPSVHDASESPTAAIKLPETSAAAARHAECPDCHNAHASNSTAALPPSVSGPLLNVKGYTSAGAGTNSAANQYEICYKCHADSANKPQYNDTGNTGIGYGRNPKRALDQGNASRYNTRLEFNSNASWHPVAKARGLSTGTGGEIPSLRLYIINSAGGNITTRPLSSASLIYCADCHNNNTGRNLSNGQTPPLGPHGSNIVHLLERAYAYNTPPATPGNTMTLVTYSVSNYALCDKCHNVASSIVANQSFPRHGLHIQSLSTGAGSACSVCHHSHGPNGGTTTSNGHLIDFDRSIVAPSSSGNLSYTDTGFRHGTCYLRCHGQDHNPLTY